MKVSYVFPIINKTINARGFFSDFSSSDFYVKFAEREIFFVVDNNDKQNLDYLNGLALKSEQIKLFVMDGKFSYNRAFLEVLPFINGDVTLLGDTGLNTNDEIFEELMAEYEDGAGVVQVKKDHGRFIDLFRKMGVGIYNFFVRMYSGNEDLMNVSSLELIDKTTIDILAALPYKANFLRNAMFLEGIDMRSVYIDPKTKVYKNNYNFITLSAIFALVLAGVFVGALATMIIVNSIEVNINIIALNIILIFVLLICLAGILIALSKHILDVRMDRLKTGTKLLAAQNVKMQDELEKEESKVVKPKTVVKRGSDDRRKTGNTRKKLN